MNCHGGGEILVGEDRSFAAFVDQSASGLPLGHEVNCWDGPAYPDLPAPGGLADSAPRWTMESDWLRRGLGVQAGPAGAYGRGEPAHRAST
ncbi:hypothetical protein SAMN05414137_12749 [Streptacidiphilus jiangxiensis]|uniref:Uncharacterized protein n=1 Tax=Streptacidiphilus jiangxiensis TaxID=235985 RepID=A0A1H7YAB1_STRJI|nr:hypothetical protein SAMN05414137_12749 [Streptacidiphilus jiangxiensis]